VGSRGSRGDTQRKPYEVARETLADAEGQQLVDIRKRSSIRSAGESELPIVPITSQGQHNLERGKGQYLHHVSEGKKERGLQ